MELAFELAPDDYPQVRRLERKPPWAQLIAAAVVVPSLAALYLGGFRVSLAIVSVVLGLVMMAGFRTAAALRQRSYLLNRCTPLVLRTAPDHLEIDGVIEWRRIDWSYVDDIRQQDGWVLIELFEGDPLIIPPRALPDDQRRRLLEEAGAARAAAAPRESSQLTNLRKVESEPVATARYTIDNNYMQSLVELRFPDRMGWSRVLIVIVLTGVGCKVWPDMAREIAATGAAIGLPILIMRILELLLRRRAMRRAELGFEIPMTLQLHQDGYQRRCRLFQSFTSWLLVGRMQVARPFVLISHSDQEHLLIPSDAWPDGGEAEFCELGNRLRHEHCTEEEDAEEEDAEEEDAEEEDAEEEDEETQVDEHARDDEDVDGVVEADDMEDEPRDNVDWGKQE